MPLYEYYCVDCHEKFETIRPISQADEPIACDICQGMNTSRMLSVFFAHSGGKVVAGSVPSCSSCASASCATCRQL
jgi:putative FmdB family regulatory protein